MKRVGVILVIKKGEFSRKGSVFSPGFFGVFFFGVKTYLPDFPSSSTNIGNKS